MRLRPLPPPGSPALDDCALVAAMQSGESAAFELFFDRQFPVLYRFTLKRVRDQEATREVVQTAICHALENLDSWRGDAPLAAWLFAICHHEIHRHFRRLKREPPHEDLDEETPADAGAAHAGNPETDLHRRRLARQVHATLDQLPTRYGLALQWKYVEGLPVAVIAERLAVGPKAAESLLTRARLAFRQFFPEHSSKGWAS